MLDRAVEVFWAHGYDATSMSDLRRAMGIGRQSLYDTFGDKKQVFSEALQRYRRWQAEGLAEALPPGSGLQAVREHLRGAVLSVTSQSPRRGCMLIRTCTQVAPADPELGEYAHGGMQALEQAYVGALKQARAEGDLRPDVDVEVAARSLASQAAGLGVLAQGGADVDDLLPIVDCAIDGLRAR